MIPNLYDRENLHGMTRSARKRAARKESVGREDWSPSSTRFALKMMRDHFKKGSWEARTLYPRMRAHWGL